MKKFLLLLTIIPFAVNTFSQANKVQTGLYYVIPKDSCSGQNSEHVMIYQSDTLCLAENPVITVKDIDTCFTASMEMDGKEVYALNIKLNKSATLKFKKVTANNIGKRFAFVIDNKIVMAPVVRDAIPNGRMTIQGEKGPKIREMGMKLKNEMRHH